MNHSQTEDIAAIRAIIARQFASVGWTVGASPDWQTFKFDFASVAWLYPSARPLRPQSLDAFIERMSGLVGTSLRSFEETVLGSRITVFGNVAVAVAACENLENGSDTNRNVEMLLLAKGERGWKIVAQAWDKASDARPVPPDLLGG